MELVRFRVAERSERAWLYGLHLAAFRGYVERVHDAWAEPSPQSRLEQVFKDHSSEVFDDVGVGVVYWRHEPRAVHIELFEIHPDFQGRGIRALALCSMLERPECPDHVRLSTGRENPARRL